MERNLVRSGGSQEAESQKDGKSFAGASVPKDHLLPSIVAPIASEISSA
jgi:hypothetical protein